MKVIKYKIIIKFNGLKTKLNDTINHFGRRRVATVGASVCVLLLAGGVTTAVALSGGFDGVNPDNSTINKTVKVEKHQGDALEIYKNK